MPGSSDIFENHLDREGAIRLRRRLTHYWHSRGFTDVQFSIVPTNYRRFALYGIRSNLVNGLPPRRTPPRNNPTMERIALAGERIRLGEFLLPAKEAA